MTRPSALALALLAALSGPAMAQEHPSITSGELWSAPVLPCQDDFRDVPALAARLGISPLRETKNGWSFVIGLCNGDRYDIFAIINAVLDRLDKAAGP